MRVSRVAHARISERVSTTGAAFCGICVCTRVFDVRGRRIAAEDNENGNRSVDVDLHNTTTIDATPVSISRRRIGHVSRYSDISSRVRVWLF